MSYTINYGQMDNFKYKASNKPRINIRVLTAGLCIAVTVLLMCITPIRSAVIDFLLPGDSAVTKQAAGDMLDDLKDGHSFKEAFSDFCKEIIDNA